MTLYNLFKRFDFDSREFLNIEFKLDSMKNITDAVVSRMFHSFGVGSTCHIDENPTVCSLFHAHESSVVVGLMAQDRLQRT